MPNYAPYVLRAGREKTVIIIRVVYGRLKAVYIQVTPKLPRFKTSPEVN